MRIMLFGPGKTGSYDPIVRSPLEMLHAVLDYKNYDGRVGINYTHKEDDPHGIMPIILTYSDCPTLTRSSEDLELLEEMVCEMWQMMQRGDSDYRPPRAGREAT